MKNLDIRRKGKLPIDFKITKTEFASKIIHGTDTANRLYGSFLSSNRVENKFEPNIKLMVLAKGVNPEKNSMLVNALTEWFYEEENTDVNSIQYSKTLSSIVSNIRSMATVESLYEAKTSFGFAISNGNGDVIIFNVGSLKHYVKPLDDDFIVDVTFRDPASSDFASLEDNGGSFFHYSRIEEVYSVQDDISEMDIEDASDYRLSAADTVNYLLYSSTSVVLSGEYGNVDRAANVLKIRKR